MLKPKHFGIVKRWNAVCVTVTIYIHDLNNVTCSNDSLCNIILPTCSQVSKFEDISPRPVHKKPINSELLKKPALR